LRKEYNWFYSIMILDGIIGFIGNTLVLVSDALGGLLSCLYLPFSFLLIVPCVVVVYKVLKNKNRKIHLILPVVYVILFLSSFLFALLVAVLVISADIPFGGISDAMTVFGIVVSLLEIGFASYMLFSSYKTYNK